MAGSERRQVGEIKPRRALWNDRNARAIAYQVFAIAAVLGIGGYLISNTMTNLAARNIATGFGFLGREAGFEIGESPIAYSAIDTYARALVVGLLNTLRVSLSGVVLATILGVAVGIARLSSNWLIARLAAIYVETLRNVPLVLQLLFWYSLVITLPPPRLAWRPLAGVFLSNRGLLYPTLEWHAVYPWMMGLMLAGFASAIAVYKWGQRRQARTGKPFAVVWPTMVCIGVPPALAFVAAGAPLVPDAPVLMGFNFRGGGEISPELFALLVGLVTYTAAFIAEVVRAGLLAVPRGQIEAARSVGLGPGLVLRLVVLPQAMRVIVPPLTSQYLNLTKNSSLAVAIAYPDLTSIAYTVINQTGQAVEGIAVLMGVYLTISLAISALMNWYNKRIMLTEH